MKKVRLIIESEAADKRSGRSIEGRGQILGFIAFLSAIGPWALYLGQIAVAIACFTTFVLGVVGMFITGRAKNTDKEQD